jgi:hypothetical protein
MKISRRLATVLGGVARYTQLKTPDEQWIYSCRVEAATLKSGVGEKLPSPD